MENVLFILALAPIAKNSFHLLYVFLRLALVTSCCLVILSLDLNENAYLIFGTLFTLIAVYEWSLFNAKRNLDKKLIKFQEQIASDLHDDVGSNLAALAMQVELFARAYPNSDVKKLEKLQAISRLTMIRMRDIVWNMKPQQKSWGQLIERLQDHASQSLDLNNVDVALKLSGINRDEQLSANICKQFYLIGKEAITNISKHSNADQVELWFERKINKFEMSIKDNGSISIKNNQLIVELVWKI